MRISVTFALCVFSLPWASSASLYGQEIPKIDGFVTRVASQSDFDANGFRVLCGANTKSMLLVHSGMGLLNQGCPIDRLFVGEPARVYGSLNKKSHTINATRIELLSLQAGPIEGSSVVEALLPETLSPGVLLLRADGHRIRITRETEISWNAPLHAISDIEAGDWIEFKGKQSVGGETIATSAKFARDEVKKGEEKLRAKYDFDSAEVQDSDKQSTASAGFFGIDPKRFPPYKNPEMQAHIDEIGNKLIPDFQRNLPDSDPTKIHFRFQLIDTNWFLEAFALPSGIILVPHQVVERTQNDSQLAAVLADSIAAVVEKELYRLLPASRTAQALFYGGMAVPFAGPAISVGGLVIAHQTAAEAQHQCERVSLGLLHDAGYDIDQAPQAWWLLSSRKPKPIAEIGLPARAAYLYRILGETWHIPALSDAPKP